jgi:hypothetical protein
LPQYCLKQTSEMEIQAKLWSNELIRNACVTAHGPECVGKVLTWTWIDMNKFQALSAGGTSEPHKCSTISYMTSTPIFSLNYLVAMFAACSCMPIKSNDGCSVIFNSSGNKKKQDGFQRCHTLGSTRHLGIQTFKTRTAKCVLRPPRYMACKCRGARHGTNPFFGNLSLGNPCRWDVHDAMPEEALKFVRPSKHY